MDTSSPSAAASAKRAVHHPHGPTPLLRQVGGVPGAPGGSPAPPLGVPQVHAGQLHHRAPGSFLGAAQGAIPVPACQDRPGSPQDWSGSSQDGPGSTQDRAGSPQDRAGRWHTEARLCAGRGRSPPFWQGSRLWPFCFYVFLVLFFFFFSFSRFFFPLPFVFL